MSQDQKVSKTDELLQEILDNARSDREKLQDAYDSLMSAVSEADPLQQAAIIEPVVMVADALTKNNSQLIELAKIRVKKDLLSSSNSNDLSDVEVNDVLDEIEKEFNEDGKN